MNKISSILLLLTLLIISACSSTTKEVCSSLKFNKIVIDTTYHMMNKTNNPAIKIKLDIEFPSAFTNKSDLQKIQNVILSSITGDVKTTEEKENLHKFVEKWINDYKANESDYTKMVDTMRSEETAPLAFNWEYQTSGKSIYCQNGILCYEIQNYSYTGGAHGSTITKYMNLDLSRERVLQLSDIFTEDYNSQLTPIIIDNLEKNNKVESKEDLENIGFFDTEEIHPIDNFIIGDKGLTFVYDQGSIAAYALGAIKVFIPYEDLKFALRPNSSISEMLQ